MLPMVVVRLLLDRQADLTTQHAADALNVARPHLVKLLEANLLPFRLTGTSRRVRYEDLVGYHYAIGGHFDVPSGGTGLFIPLISGKTGSASQQSTRRDKMAIKTNS